MTVVSSGNTLTFAGDGVQTLFDFNFRIFREDDLCAVLRSSTGEERKLAQGSDFAIVSGVGSDSGGRISYPVSGSPLAAGETITLYREIPYSQELELVDNDPFSASLLNEAFDRGVMRDQQLQEQVNRSLKYDISTPLEEQLSPQEFMRSISQTRESVVVSQGGAEAAGREAVAAQNAAQASENSALAAMTGAEAARDAAEAARDAAKAISLGDIALLRSLTPVLGGPSEAYEGTTATIQITDYVDDSITSYDVNVFGFGSASISGGTISWKLGSLDADADHCIEVLRRKRGDIQSEPAKHTILVRRVVAQDGPTIVFSDSAAGWNKVPDSMGIEPPACSVAAENTNQVISAQMEITDAGAEMPVLAGSTGKTLKLGKSVMKGDWLITDQGETVVNEASTTPETVAKTFSHNSGGTPYTCSNYLGVKYVATGNSFRKAYFQGDAMQGAYVTLAVQIWNEDQTVKLFGNGPSVNHSTAGWVVLEFAENTVEPGTAYWIIVEFTEHDASKYWNMLSGTSSAGILQSYRGNSIPMSTSAGGDWNFEIEERFPGETIVSVTPELAASPTKMFKNPFWSALELVPNSYAPLTDQGSYIYSAQHGGTPQGNPFVKEVGSTQDGTAPFYGLPGSADQWFGTSGGADSVDTFQYENYQSSHYAPTAIKIQKSMDGIVWEDVASFTGLDVSGYAVNRVDFPAFTTPYRRALSLDPVGDGWLVWSARWMNRLDMQSLTTIKSIGQVAEGDRLKLSEKEVVAGKVTETGEISDIAESGIPGGDIVTPGFWSSIGLKVPNGGNVTHLGYKNSGQPAAGKIILYRVDTETTLPTSNGGSYQTVAVADFVYGESGNYEYFPLTEPFRVPQDGKSYRLGIKLSSGYIGKVDGMSTDGIYTLESVISPGDVWKAELDSYVPTIAARTDDRLYSIDLSHESLTAVPAFAARHSGIELALGAGVAGEYLGPEVGLTLSQGENILPVMAAQTTAGCTITASSFHNTYPAWNVGAGGGGWWIVDTGFITPSADLTISFISEQTASSLRLTAPSGGNTSAYQPRTIGIYLDGVLEDTWLTGDWDAVNGETKEFSFSSIKRFSTLKLACSNSLVGNYVGCNIIEILAPGLSTTSDLILESTQSIKDKIYTAGGLHNNIEIDGVSHDVASVSEVVNSQLQYHEQSGTIGQYATDTGLWVNEDVVIPAGSIVTALGNDSNLSSVVKVALFRKISPALLEVAAIASGTNNTTGSGYQYFNLDTPFAVPDDGCDYIVGVAVSSGSYGRAAGTGLYASGFNANAGDTIGVSSNTNYPFVGAQCEYKTYSSTAKLTTLLAQPPAGNEVVVIPNRCALAPSSLAAQIAGNELKISADMITLVNDPALRRLAMTVKGSPDMRFKSGRMYIKERI